MGHWVAGGSCLFLFFKNPLTFRRKMWTIDTLIIANTPHPPKQKWPMDNTHGAY